MGFQCRVFLLKHTVIHVMYNKARSVLSASSGLHVTAGEWELMAGVSLSRHQGAEYSSVFQLLISIL